MLRCFKYPLPRQQRRNAVDQHVAARVQRFFADVEIDGPVFQANLLDDVVGRRFGQLHLSA